MLGEAARSEFITIIRVDGLGLRRPSGSCFVETHLKPHAAPPDWTFAFPPVIYRLLQQRFVLLSSPGINACFSLNFSFFS